MISSLDSKFAVILLLALTCSCTNKEIPTGIDCTLSGLLVTSPSITPTSSCSVTDGQVTLSGSGGTAPYTYSLNGGAFQENPVFTNLGAGTYAMQAKDAKGCTASVDVTVTAANSTLAATSDTSIDAQCFPPHNGSITVTPTGGVAPYQLKIGSGAFGAATTFSGLAKGTYTVVVLDTEGCSISLNIIVAQNTGTSYATDIAPILTANCTLASCHGPGNSIPNLTGYANASARANGIKTRTGNGSMPPAGSPDLTPDQIQRIACWVDDGAKNN